MRPAIPLIAIAVVLAGCGGHAAREQPVEQPAGRTWTDTSSAPRTRSGYANDGVSGVAGEDGRGVGLRGTSAGSSTAIEDPDAAPR